MTNMIKSAPQIRMSGSRFTLTFRHAKKKQKLIVDDKPDLKYTFSS